MKIYQEQGAVVLTQVQDFEPKHIFECGQSFRWTPEEDGSYTGVAGGRILNVAKQGEDVYLNNTTLEDYENFWRHYFDMDRNYEEIRNQLALMDPHLQAATEFGQGLRVLNQDSFEAAISFIISSNNNIPRIQRAVEYLSRHLGEPIGEYRGKDYYAFPTPKALAHASSEVYRQSNVGYRESYIRDTSIIQHTGQMDIYKLVNLPTAMAKKELIRLPGVGPKVSDCILLFGLEKEEVFPVDVWVRRVMEELYFQKNNQDLQKIRQYALEKFGLLSGLAQQYLFYYARAHGIGRK